MRGRARGRGLAFCLAGAVALAATGWLAARQIRSPAQVAADTAAPTPSLITVPVQRQTLSTEVIVRGTVRYGAPQAVALPVSALKTGSELISRPPRRNRRLREGSVALSVSGRPVFVLQGTEPAYRDLAPGTQGADVRQLETALARMGYAPGPQDGSYDGSTAAAVAAWYRAGGWTPFGATDTQAEQLRVAQSSADGARDTLLQTRLTLKAARQGATPADINQARLDAVTATDAADTATLAIRTTQVRIDAAGDAVGRAVEAEAVASAATRRDVAAAEVEVSARRAALNAAVDAQAEAQRRLDQAPPETTPSERESLRAALRQAIDAVGVARGAIDVALGAVEAARAAGAVAVSQARADARTARREVVLATAERDRARRSLTTARRQTDLARARVQILQRRPGTALERRIVSAAAAQVQRAQADVRRAALRAGIQVPADELLFFSSLPLRIDAVKARRGDPVSGRLMTVSNSRLAIDSSLSPADAKLVRPGLRARIEEQDLGVKIGGVVRHVADKPGTNLVDPSRVYLEVAPTNAPPVLVGASVRLAIAVKSTRGAVLAVPVAALSVVADGTSRVQVDTGNGRTRFVTVVPGLAAQGLVEVRPVGRRLHRGDLVVVGAGGLTAPPVGTALPAAGPAAPSGAAGAGAGARPAAAARTGPGGPTTVQRTPNAP